MARNRALGSPLQTRIVSADHTTHKGTDYYCVASVPVVITLDPNAVDNDQVVIQDITNEAAANPIVINASEGQTILNGYGDSITIDTDGGAVQLTMTPDGWVPVFYGSGSGGGVAYTAAVVTSANSPYEVLHTDILIEFDESNGALATAVLPASGMVVSEKHTFIWWGWTGGSPPPLIEGNGKNVVPYAPGAQTSKQVAGSTNINSNGGRYTVEWDGTQWMCTNAN